MTALKHNAGSPQREVSVSETDQTKSSSTPLDQLAEILHDDMEATNATIIDRSKSHIPMISQIAEYLIAAGGKRIRPLLTIAAASLCGTTRGAAHIAAAVEFIHTATLLHDDVVDESAQRRGKPAANIVYGNKSTVLVGDFLFGRAFELMVESNDIRILDILARASRIISEGEVLQMALTGDLDITLDQYREVIDAKTAALFSAASQSGAICGGADEKTAHAMRDYGHHLGMAFQMIDDVMDYEGVAAKMGKESGDDFREGKLTLPVIIALKAADETERAFWSRTMKDHDQTPEDLATARKIIARHDAASAGRAIARDHAHQARHALESLPKSPMRGVLDELLDFVVSRNH